MDSQNINGNDSSEKKDMGQEETNMGTMSMENYLDIKAMQYGFEDYADLKKHELYLEKVMKKGLFFKICRVCALIWIITFMVAFGTIVITGGDFTQLGFLLEQPHLSENYVIIKTILNIGLNLHITTALPSAFAFMNLKNNKPTN